MEQKVASVQLVGKKQVSVLSRSLMVCGIGFLIICGLAFLINSTLYNGLVNNTKAVETWLPILYVLSGLFAIISLVMTFVMMKKIHVAKTSTLLLTMGFYIISEAILFGILFTALQLDGFGIENLSLCFGITGVIFAGTGVLGNLMSRNATASLGRFLWTASIIALFTFLIVMVLSVTGIITGTTWLWLSAVMGVLSVLYLLHSFAVIKHSKEWIGGLDTHAQNNYIIFFGYMLLIDLMQLLFYVLRIASIFLKR